MILYNGINKEQTSHRVYLAILLFKCKNLPQICLESDILRQFNTRWRQTHLDNFSDYYLKYQILDTIKALIIQNNETS